MIEYSDIVRVNNEIHTTDIKGKAYAEVNQRVKAFRMLYPQGTIQTEMISCEGGICIFKATVSDCDLILATGTAYEKEGSTFINQTSYIENAETSAVGRALGFAGFGIDTSIASAEEVQNAQLNQKDYIDARMVKSLRERCGDSETEEKICGLYKVSKLEELTVRQLANINQNWGKIKGE